MRFVRPALNYKEQNLIISQQGEGIVFLTVRNILPKEELKAGPSPEYASARNLSVLVPDPKDKTGRYNFTLILNIFSFFSNLSLLNTYFRLQN